MKKSQFSTSAFISSNKPWDYMIQEAGLAEFDSTISEQELSALYDVLNDLDEVRLAFALAVAENFAPVLFAHKAAKLLGHPSMSVRINAYRVIRAIPAEFLSDEVREAVAVGLSKCPEQAAFADALVRS